MSHIRSASVRGDMGDLVADVVGSVVHDVTVVRKEAYLSDWAGVRVGGGGGTDAAERWETGSLEGSGAGFSFGGPPFAEVRGGSGAG